MLLLGKIMILQGVGHPISCLGVCYANDPQKGGYMTPAPALDLTTSLRGDSACGNTAHLPPAVSGTVLGKSIGANSTWRLNRLKRSEQQPPYTDRECDTHAPRPTFALSPHTSSDHSCQSPPSSSHPLHLPPPPPPRPPPPHHSAQHRHLLVPALVLVAVHKVHRRPLRVGLH